MSSMNISLPEALKAYVDAQVEARGYGTASEFVSELIRKDQDDIQRFREKILEGMRSPIDGPLDKAYFDSLRARLATKTST